MTAKGMNFRLQRSGGTHDGIGGKRGCDDCSTGIAPGIEQRRKRVGTGKLSAVNQGKSLFWPQNQRRKIKPAFENATIMFIAINDNFALSD